MKALVLFGSPGSGKGTQAKVLRQCLGVPHISTGDMLRDGLKHGSRLGVEVDRLMKAGSLVPDAVVNGLVEERLSQPDAKSGFILDGYPRTRAQAEHLGRWLNGQGSAVVVIHLAVDYNVIIARLTGRRQCPQCGTLYNVSSNPPKREGLCDLDGSALVVRDDDREAVIRERLEEYERLTRPVLDYYRAAGRPVIAVSGTEPPEEIAKTICRVLDSNDSAENAG